MAGKRLGPLDRPLVHQAVADLARGHDTRGKLLGSCRDERSLLAADPMRYLHALNSTGEPDRVAVEEVPDVLALWRPYAAILNLDDSVSEQAIAHATDPLTGSGWKQAVNGPWISWSPSNEDTVGVRFDAFAAQARGLATDPGGPITRTDVVEGLFRPRAATWLRPSRCCETAFTMRLTLDGDWNATVTGDPLRITPRFCALSTRVLITEYMDRRRSGGGARCAACGR
ncbi:hypothetical protein ACFCZY_04070 [Streptomyces sp. NPDC056237]|uniref:hypothetical protein n=1 Tax=unclassified Streptomyces TaxID=2593676 RepID=UPI0035DF8B9D